MRRAVVYYSLTDNTKEAAEYLAKELGADLINIELVKPMPDDFKKQMLIGGMKTVFNMTPAIKGIPDNIGDYDEIIVGGPIWAGKIAAPAYTFLKKCKVADKVVAVFTFSGGGDNDKCIAVLSKLLPNMRTSVALADRNHNTAPDNHDKLNAFLNGIVG